MNSNASNVSIAGATWVFSWVWNSSILDEKVGSCGLAFLCYHAHSSTFRIVIYYLWFRSGIFSFISPLGFQPTIPMHTYLPNNQARHMPSYTTPPPSKKGNPFFLVYSFILSISIHLVLLQPYPLVWIYLKPFFSDTLYQEKRKSLKIRCNVRPSSCRKWK